MINYELSALSTIQCNYYITKPPIVHFYVINPVPVNIIIVLFLCKILYATRFLVVRHRGKDMTSYGQVTGKLRASYGQGIELI